VRHRPAALVLAAALLIPAGAAVAAPATAAPVAHTVAARSAVVHTAVKKATCKVSMSVSKPRQYSWTTVRVSHVGAKAKVTTAVHYKTTTNTKHVKASSKGAASVRYYISGAKAGKKVPVTVTATTGAGSHKKTWTCSTSFTPKKR
jgi:hypothetical protein